MIDHSLSGTISLFCFCAFFFFFFYKYLLFLLQPKLGLTYALSIVNWILFEKKNIADYFLLFITDFKLLMCHKNIMKMSEVLKKWNWLKTCIQTTHPIKVCIIYNHFYHGEKWKFFIFYFLFIKPPN